MKTRIILGLCLMTISAAMAHNHSDVYYKESRLFSQIDDAYNVGLTQADTKTYDGDALDAVLYNQIDEVHAEGLKFYPITDHDPFIDIQKAVLHTQIMGK